MLDEDDVLSRDWQIVGWNEVCLPKPDMNKPELPRRVFEAGICLEAVDCHGQKKANG